MNRQLKEDHGTVQDVPGRNTGSKAPNRLGTGGQFTASACLPLRTGLLQYKDQLPINEPVGWWILEAVTRGLSLIGLTGKELEEI